MVPDQQKWVEVSSNHVKTVPSFKWTKKSNCIGTVVFFYSVVDSDVNATSQSNTICEILSSKWKRVQMKHDKKSGQKSLDVVTVTAHILSSMLK